MGGQEPKQRIDAQVVDNDTLGSPPEPTKCRNLYQKHKIAFAVAQFGSGPAFGAFATYVGYQLQLVGYTIGHEPGAISGSGCSPSAVSCLVPFAGHGSINLTASILYLQAISYAISAILCIVISGIGDQLGHQRGQYIGLLMLYGGFCLPSAGIKAYSISTYNGLSALYVLFNITGFLVQVWGRIFVPFLMHKVDDENEHNLNPAEAQSTYSRGLVREATGVKMSLWGSNALNGSQIILYIVVIGLSYVSYARAGLYATTACGVLCIGSAVLAWPWLPSPPRRRSWSDEPVKLWVITPLVVLKDLIKCIKDYPEALKLLAAYTIYVDSTFIFGSVIGQLFNLNVRPSVRELTAYSIVGPVASMVSAVLFASSFTGLERKFGCTLRRWAIFSYITVMFVCFWCCLGISGSVTIGFKSRWEFYVMAAVQNISGSIFAIVFSVLYSELFPRGKEIEYFGFQLVLSCGTVWIGQVVNGPIVSASNNLRLPAVVTEVALVVGLGLLLCMDETKGMEKASQLSSQGPEGARV